MMRALVVIPLLLIGSAASASSGSECKNLIRAFGQALDDNHKDNFDAVTWHDGVKIDETGNPYQFRKILFRESRHDILTFRRSMRLVSSSETVQIVTNKEIMQRLEFSDYNGQYEVTKNRYRCERRSNVWRIAKKTVTSIFYGQNKPVAREWRQEYADMLP